MTKTKAQAIQDWIHKKQGPRRKATEGDKYFFYELRKRGLQSRNLSPEEYEIEIQKIARELGI